MESAAARARFSRPLARGPPARRPSQQRRTFTPAALCCAYARLAHPSSHRLQLDRTAAPRGQPWLQHAAWRATRRPCTHRRPCKRRSQAPCARPAYAVGRWHRHQNRGAAFGTGDVLRASSDQVDDVGAIWQLGAGARRHAQQLGHATPKGQQHAARLPQLAPRRESSQNLTQGRMQWVTRHAPRASDRHKCTGSWRQRAKSVPRTSQKFFTVKRRNFAKVGGYPRWILRWFYYSTSLSACAALSATPAVLSATPALIAVLERPVGGGAGVEPGGGSSHRSGCGG